MRRITSSIITLAMVLAACGTTANPTETTPPGISQTTSTQPTSTSTTADSTTTTILTSTTTLGTTPVTAAPTTTTPPATATGQLNIAPWFFIDEAGHENRTGPFLLPVHRNIASTKAVARASLEQLFAGPTIDEASGIPAISTTVPADVRVLGLTIREGIATVDLSAEFGGTESSPVVAQRMAQVVFTLTSIPHVNEVVFHQGGKPIAAQTSDGQLVKRPVLKADYLDFAGAVTVEQPAYTGRGANPLHVTGFAAAFEAVFQYALTDDDGLIIAEGHAMTTNGTGWGGFDFTIDYEVGQKHVGALIVWINSAKDGSRIDIREYPVTLVP